MYICVYMNNIIKGYKGIMDLDLSSIPKQYHNDVINQHYKDIDEYKKYQIGLKKEQRYENTVERIQAKLKHHSKIEKKRKLAETQRRIEAFHKTHF